MAISSSDNRNFVGASIYFSASFAFVYNGSINMNAFFKLVNMLTKLQNKTKLSRL